MKAPYIKVELVDGTDTWISVMPIHQLDHIGALLATGDVFTWFISNLTRDERAVDQHLAAFKVSS